jgi:flagellar basal body-associated protein FliL
MEITAVIVVVFLIAVAAITFFVLKKAVKMAIRAAIVALILLIAIAGGISFWMFSDKSSGSATRPQSGGAANTSNKSAR